ncbi:MAG: UDP-N-acetylmuramoyl-L-alanyl-D-glutamate--2,6-diaminopimelate ligase [bacterium]|nr:UDP-N-acetylmuramoyl-L-alanyl-D-glutamate--2,6-diaminopimelate ligase [bacterium]
MDFLRRLLGQRRINLYHLVAAIAANLIYGFPSRKLKVIGVTGTDGKTTTVNLIASVLKQGGKKVSFLSSINAQIGEQTFDTGLHTTTPSSFLLQKLLAKMVRAGSDFAVLEVTSHALDQHRVWGIDFQTAVLTNITPEHLDYHKTFEEYSATKMKLFKNVEYGVVNNDFLGSKQRFTTYGLDSKAQIWADEITEDLQSTNFSVNILNSKFKIHLQLPGKFNVLNALAAISVGQIYKIPKEDMISGLLAVKSIPGRMEYIEEGQDFLAMVDFAHTPNALKNLLSFVRAKIAGKIVLVFGSAGERDAQKRPEMGKVAAEFADMIVITREDNRSEKVEKISEQIISGMGQKIRDRDYFVIPDRREALRFALQKARKSDIVVITGKGHEQSLNIDGQETPWDDRRVMREELRTLRSTN